MGPAFSHHNRSKQAADLRVARILARFEKLRGKVTDVRGINLGHVLEHHGGSKHALPITIDENGNLLRYSLAKISATEVIDAPLWTDDLSSLRHGFARLPIEYLFHDDRLNPRGIGSNIRGLAIEFFAKFPQLHVPLAWIDSKEEGGPRVRIFDGQHKAAAQVLLGVRYLPLRIFVDPDPDLLLTANTIEKAIYSQTIFGGMLDTPDDHKVEAGDNPRDLVREQIVTLLNIIADRIFVGERDPVIGSGKLESKVQKDQDVPEGHLRAHRLAREEILQAWLELALSVCQTVVVSSGQIWNAERPFHRRLPDALWQSLDCFVVNFSNLPRRKSCSLSSTVLVASKIYSSGATLSQRGRPTNSPSWRAAE